MTDSRVIRGEVWSQRLCQLLALTHSAADIENWMELETRIIKRDAWSRVGLLTIEHKLCYLKYYQAKSAQQSLLFRFGFGRGARSFDMAQKLALAGVAVPEPRACLGVPGGMLLLTEGLAGATDLKNLWLERPSEERLRELMASAGRALAELHGAGYVHGDCKWSNLVDSGGRFFFVDLEAVQRARQGASTMARDLARFTVNAEDMGLPPEHYQIFLSTYATDIGREHDHLIQAMLMPLQRLRRKHQVAYGPRGHQLI